MCMSLMVLHAIYVKSEVLDVQVHSIMRNLSLWRGVRLKVMNTTLSLPLLVPQ
jgi:hypothetical protein